MKKLLVSYSSPGLFGLSEKLQGTVTCTVKAGLLVSGLPDLGPLFDRNRTLEVLLAVGERAYDLYANDQAAHHFGAALALIREGHRTELMPSVLEKLGEAWERVGETAAAIAVWSEARTLYERARNVSLLVRLHRRLALAEWDYGHFDAARAHLEAGLPARAGSEPSAELAELLHVQVILLKRHGDLNGVSTAAQNLATLAERLGSQRTNRGQVYPFSTNVGWLRDVGYEAVERIDLSPTPPISLITARRPTAEEEE